MSATAGTPKRERLIRIGEVVRRLRDEFPDISISKIRYLEDQKLLEPKRTPGGYRLYSQSDVARLTDILTGKVSPDSGPAPESNVTPET